MQSYGIYLAYYLRQNPYPYAGLVDYAFVGGFNFSLATLVAPFVIISARNLGTQFCMAVGAILLATGFISASFAKEVWQLYLSQGLLVGFGVGFTHVPSIAVLPQWLDKKRSLFNGISAAGSGIGGLVFCFASEAMISNISLAWSLRITGIICGFMNIAAAIFIRNRNETVKPPQRGFDIKLLCRYDVSLLLVLSVTIMDEWRQQVFLHLGVALLVLLFGFLQLLTGLPYFLPSSTAPFLVFFGS